ncbi:MAG: 16S rRNA (guanine966-N2)-methyltransferase [Lysobacterales bacterium]|jgi:16S rRNA (guanine966-N2)-methyltransferase
MKIIGGKYRGRNIFMPIEIRPTKNMARKAVFDYIGHDLEGITFLELFAGSGAVGIEALSRDAQKVVFIEKDPKCYDVIQENLDLLKIDESDAKVKILNQDAYMGIKMLAHKKEQFDVVFADPPYNEDKAKKALKVLEGYDILHANSLLILETHRNESLPKQCGRFLLFKEKVYGLAKLWIYKVQE